MKELQLSVGECLFASTILNPQGFIVNPYYLGLLELSSWMQVGAQVYRCMLHSQQEEEFSRPTYCHPVSEH